MTQYLFKDGTKDNVMIDVASISATTSYISQKALIMNGGRFNVDAKLSRAQDYVSVTIELWLECCKNVSLRCPKIMPGHLILRMIYSTMLDEHAPC